MIFELNYFDIYILLLKIKGNCSNKNLFLINVLFVFFICFGIEKIKFLVICIYMF